MKNVYNPIAIYNYNNKKYFIAFDDGNIIFFKYEDGKITMNYSKDEIIVFLKVYKSIKINKKTSINYGIRKINGKLFEFHYDKTTRLYYWYQIVNGNRCRAADEDIQELNYKYNNMPIVYADNDIYDWAQDENFLKNEAKAKKKAQIDAKKKKIKTITRTIVNKGATIAVIILAGNCLIDVADANLHTNIKDTIKNTIGITEEVEDVVEPIDDPFRYEDIEDAISSNPNLTYSEKDFIKKLEFYFKENSSSFRVRDLKDRMRTLKISYDKNPCEDQSVSGEYSVSKNEITIYSATSFEDADIRTVMHEILHSIQDCGSNRFIMELSNEMTSREVLRYMVENGIIDADRIPSYLESYSYGIGYDECMKVYYLLAELISPYNLKKYQICLSDFLITDELVKIEKQNGTSSSEADMTARAFDLLDEIDNLREEVDGKKYLQICYTDEKYKKIRDSLDYYYQLKFGKTIDEYIEASCMEYSNLQMNDINTIKDQAICDVLFDIWKEDPKTLKEDPTEDCHIEDCRIENCCFFTIRRVWPKTYLSDAHQYPIVQCCLQESNVNGFYQGYVYNYEITPDIENEYEKRYAELKNDINKDDVDR